MIASSYWGQEAPVATETGAEDVVEEIGPVYGGWSVRVDVVAPMLMGTVYEVPTGEAVEILVE